MMSIPDLAFLPDWPLPISGLALFGALLLAGLFGGVLARWVGLPAITGYIVVGMLLGQTGLRFLTPELLAQSRPFIDISLGLILFDLGRRLDFNWLRKNPYLLFSAISESLLSFTLIYVTLYYLGLPLLFAAIAAAIGMAGSPVVVMLIAHEQRAEGQVTERALNLVALNSVLAYVVVAMLLAGLHFEYRSTALAMFLHPLYLLAGSALLGVTAAHATIQLGRRLGKRDDRQFVMLVAMIILTVGCAALLKLSVVLALLVFGMAAKNLDRRHDLMPVQLVSNGQLFFVVLFVVTGAMLDARELLVSGGMALAYIAARCAGKILGVMPWSMLSGLSRERAVLLGATLTPMAGFMLVRLQDVWKIYPEFYLDPLSVVISAVVILEVIGPIVVQYALRRAGEADTRSG